MPAPMLSAFNVHNALAPKKGPKAIRLDLDFSAVTSIEVDLTKEQDAEMIEFIQAMWIDNYVGARRIDIVIQGVPMPLKVPALSSGMFPIIHPGHFRATFSVSAIMATPVAVIFLNVPMAAFIYLPGAA